MTQEQDSRTPGAPGADAAQKAKPKQTTRTTARKAPVKKTAAKTAAGGKDEAAPGSAAKGEAASAPTKTPAQPKTKAKAKPAASRVPAAKGKAAPSSATPQDGKDPNAPGDAARSAESPAGKRESKAVKPSSRARGAKKTAGTAVAAKAAPEAVPPLAARDDAPGEEPPKAPARGRSRGGRNRPAQRQDSAEAGGGAQAESGPVPETAPEARDPSAADREIPSAQADGEPVGDTAAEPSRSSSRRGRRGGRRRNKSRAANGSSPSEAENSAAAPGGDDTEAARQAAPKSANSGPRQPAPKDGKKEQAPDKSAKADSKDAGKRTMYVSVLTGELVEVVITVGGVVQEYYVEMLHQAKVKGNIYKGVVSNIDANLQAAFISYAGGVKNGFLQIDEVHPEYYLAPHDASKRKYPLIQKVLKPGQEILVQVVKEPAGTKGAFLTSYLSLPGRFLVLTPGREQIGVSRKVDSDEERHRLKGMLEGLKPGKGLGVIVRTVSEGASKTSLQRDLQFLKRLWKEVRARGTTAHAPSLIYEELDLSTRAVRDYLTDEIAEVWVDDPSTAQQVTELAELLFPRKKDLVQVHRDGTQSMLERFSLQKQLDQIHAREVALPSGGRLVFDNTEALTAIDINSGRSSGKNNFEDMAYRTNIEAARMIPLQLRLRDIGGQVVVDFIEMRDRNHWREVEKAVATGMKGDRARYDIGKIGPFGMLEIVRQRLGSSAISISTEPCPCCKGTGIRRNMEWQAMQSLREINRQMRAAAANNQASMVYAAEQELAFYLLNTKRRVLESMERESGVTISIHPERG